MALYRFEAKIISRAGGRSSVGAAAYRTGKCATASAAYRAGATMVDERTGKRFDYSKKKGVHGAEVMLPLAAPRWMQDRTQLWNAVEKIEKRHDAQLARDFVISLPHELPHEERVKLIRAFVRDHFVAKNLVADIAWHAPEKRGDPRNYHAHVMVSMRRVDGDGFAKRKERAPGKLHPMQQWKKELESLRQAWAEHGALALDRAGLRIEAERFRVGHLALKKQRELAIKRGDLDWAEQLDREAEPKQGPLATKMEREGRESNAGNDRRAVQQRNAELTALKAEHAAVNAEIIILELERVKRGHMDEPTDDLLERQHTREAELLEEAKEREAALVAFRQRKQQEAEEARRQEEERKRAEAVRAREGEIADPRSRYAQALGEHYDVRDPYTSLARASMAEYRAFAKQQEEYRKQEAAEQDPEKRKLIGLARQIEAHDYMAITSERLSCIGRQLAGPGAERRAQAEGRTTQASLDDAKAVAHTGRSKELREQRNQLVDAAERQGRRVDTAELHKLGRMVESREGEMTDRGAERLGKLQNVSALYAQRDAARASRGRDRGGRSR